MHGGNGIKKLAEVVHKGRLDILSYYTLYKRKKRDIVTMVVVAKYRKDIIDFCQNFVCVFKVLY